jgi:hypothetical protein
MSLPPRCFFIPTQVHLYPSFPCQQHCSLSGLLVPQSRGDLPRVGSGACTRHDDLDPIGKIRALGGGARDGQRASVNANFGLVPLLFPIRPLLTAFTSVPHAPVPQASLMPVPLSHTGACHDHSLGFRIFVAHNSKLEISTSLLQMLGIECFGCWVPTKCEYWQSNISRVLGVV